MKRTTWIAAVAAALVSTAVVAAPGAGGYGMGGGYGMRGYGPGPAQGEGGWGPGACYGPGRGALEALNLSAQQRAEIAAVFEETAAERLKIMEAMQAQRAQGFKTGTYDYAAMKTLRDRMFALHDEQREGVNAVLTPEQRQQLQAPGYGRFGWMR